MSPPTFHADISKTYGFGWQEDIKDGYFRYTNYDLWNKLPVKLNMAS
jgi:hypothetical protein